MPSHPSPVVFFCKKETAPIFTSCPTCRVQGFSSSGYSGLSTKPRELAVLCPHHPTAEKGGLEITLLESMLRRLPLPAAHKGLWDEDQKLSRKEHLGSLLLQR